MAAARVGRGVAIVSDDDTEMPVEEGSDAVVDTVAGVTMEVEVVAAVPCRGVPET